MVKGFKLAFVLDEKSIGVIADEKSRFNFVLMRGLRRYAMDSLSSDGDLVAASG